MRGCLVLVLALATAPAQARADSADAGPDAPASELPAADADLGPVITIEAITIEGNTATRDAIIRRALPLAEGDSLKASDPRLRDARFKLLALGFFRDVSIGMRKGSERGRVILDIHVIERGTLTLNRLWFGSSDFSRSWGGIDVGDRNFLGLGLSIGAGVIYASPGHFDQQRGRQPGEPQRAAELRIGASAIRGSRWGLQGSLTYAHGSDYHEVSFDGDDTSYAWGFEYERLTGRVGTSYDLTPLTRLSAQLRTERIKDLDAYPSRTGLLQNAHDESYVNTLAVAFDHDTRTDPILPHTGTRTTLVFEGGTRALPFHSDYTFATLFGRVEHWIPMRGGRTALGLKASGGQVFGDAPRFDYIYINDVDPMLAPRALGLLLSDAQPLALLRNGDLTHASPAFGTLGGLGTLEVTTELFRGRNRKRVYGGDVFVAGGLWALSLPSRSGTGPFVNGAEGLAVDFYVDAGLRFDTEIGIFELTIGNAIGRIR